MRRPALLALGAALLLAISAPLPAQEFGRLFLTPEQRETLNARRRARVPDKPAAVVVESPVTPFDGHVSRSSGRSTLWLGGQLLRDGAMPDGMRIAPNRDAPGQVSIKLGESDVSVDLKVGQALVRDTGAVRDPLDARAPQPAQDAVPAPGRRAPAGAEGTPAPVPGGPPARSTGSAPVLAAPPPLPRKY